MTDRIAHRGPDDWGTKTYADERQAVSLGHRRLSIIDLSAAGHQPMANEDETVWIVFNGEIYNFPYLRQLLVAQGHCFRSKTDTEVLVHGYEEWGLNLLPRLNGIFAFAVWDARRCELHLARDRYGVKPLYYTESGGRFVFASEVKALLCDPHISREVEPEALLTYVRFRYCPEPLTLFRSIRKLPPGHTLTLGQKRSEPRPFHELTYVDDFERPDEAFATEQLREILTRAVGRQMMSDVPVGLFLSGGIDSGGLLALARKMNPEPIKTFTIGFRQKDQRFEGQPDDVRYARKLARHFKTDHQEIILEPRIVDLLPKVIFHLDDPIADPAAITSLLVCQAAREQGTKVLLSGQGGDEVFCGYPWHLAVQIARTYGKLPRSWRKALEGLLEWLPAAKGGALTGTFRRLRKFNRSASLNFEDQLIGFLSYAYREDLDGLMGAHYGESVAHGVPECFHRAILSDSQNWCYINRMLHLDMATFLPSLNLMYTDKTSMAHGIEVRVPYLDNEVVDFMSGMPPDFKLRRFTRKHLLKRALGGLVPDEIIHRPKAGFGAPIRTWMVSDLKDMIGDLLSESNLRRRGYFCPLYVNRLIEANRSGRHDYNYLIYILLSFEIWCRVYLDDHTA